jgi:very-short-patch-repair endonuclease
MSLKSVSVKGRWCSYCSHQKLCENIDCIMCYNNSFASVERSKLLTDKNINPRTLFKSTNKKFSFNCDICYRIFNTQLSDVTKGVWCPYCVNKTEKLLFNELVFYYPKIKCQYKVDWCKNKFYLPFDFVIEELKVIIELDGKHHLETVSNWGNLVDIKKRDLYKMKCANDNGFSIIRILQKDIYKNTYDWLSELLDNINKIEDDMIVQNIYMCKKNEYKDFDKEINTEN